MNKWPKIDELTKCQNWFIRLRESNIIQLSEIISDQEVLNLLGDNALKFMTSKNFHLRNIPVIGLKVNGNQHVKRSMSLGPIFVDLTKNNELFVLDGKHRVLQAIQHKQTTIEAYVGDKAIKAVFPHEESA